MYQWLPSMIQSFYSTKCRFIHPLYYVIMNMNSLMHITFKCIRKTPCVTGVYFRYCQLDVSQNQALKPQPILIVKTISLGSVHPWTSIAKAFLCCCFLKALFVVRFSSMQKLIIHYNIFYPSSINHEHCL